MRNPPSDNKQMANSNSEMEQVLYLVLGIEHFPSNGKPNGIDFGSGKHSFEESQ